MQFALAILVANVSGAFYDGNKRRGAIARRELQNGSELMKPNVRNALFAIVALPRQLRQHRGALFAGQGHILKVSSRVRPHAVDDLIKDPRATAKSLCARERKRVRQRLPL